MYSYICRSKSSSEEQAEAGEQADALLQCANLGSAAQIRLHAISALGVAQRVIPNGIKTQTRAAKHITPR